MSTFIHIGFIGLGRMGYPMASHLVRANYQVDIYDINLSQAQHFQEHIGGRVAANLNDLIACDILITMLPTGAIVKSVLLDPSLFDHLRPGTVVIDMSSSEPTTSVELSQRLQQKQVHFFDAPVSGGVARAESATLTIMYGGVDSPILPSILPILQKMGKQLFGAGAVGAAHAVKALNNYVAAAAYTATAEALIIAEKFGIDLSVFTEILNVSTGRNFFTDLVIRQHVLNEQFNTGFTIGLLTKDVGIAAQLARAMDQPAPLLECTKARWEQAKNTLGPNLDNSAAIRAWK